MKKINLIFAKIVTLALALFFGYAFFAWTLLPYFQMASMYDLINKGEVAHLTASSFVFSPYTYVQAELRNKFLYFLFNQYSHADKEIARTFLPLAIAKMEETTVHEPGFEKYFLALGEAYNLLSRLVPGDKAKNLTLSGLNYQKSLALMAGNPLALYGYAFNLADEGKFAESAAILKNFLKSDSVLPEAHAFFGEMLFRDGESRYNDALKELEISLLSDNVFRNEIDNFRIIYTKLFAYYYNQKDLAHFIIVNKRLQTLDQDQGDLYKKVEEYINKNHTFPKIQINLSS